MEAWVDGNVVRMLWLYITIPRIPTSEVSTLLRNLNVELGGMCVVLTNGLAIRRFGAMGTWVPLSRDGEGARSYLAPGRWRSGRLVHWKQWTMLIKPSVNTPEPDAQLQQIS